MEPQILPPSPLLTFGSLNVNGLDTEAHWAVSELVRDRNIDVRFKLEMVYISYVIIRFLLSARLLEDPKHSWIYCVEDREVSNSL